MKIGRNDPCLCGKKKEDGSPVKYKKCCGFSGQNTEPPPERRKMILTKKDFVSEPYSSCPNCSQESFGLQLMGMRGLKCTKECFLCGHAESYPLPKLKKKIIYLDQFAIDNIVKTLDSKHPKNKVVSDDPFWLQMYEKLDMLSKAQLIVCPDSFYHIDESAPTGYFESMQRIYEHLSGGVTFYRESEITKIQVLEHFKNYLENKSDVPPKLDPELIVFGDLNEWHSRVRVSVSGKKTEERIKETRKEKEESYKRFTEVFKRWQIEKGKLFEDFYKEEMQGFAKGTLLSARNFYERKAQTSEKYAETGQIDMNDIFPPPSAELLEDMMAIARQNGAKNDQESIEKIIGYLSLSNLEMIPTLRIGTSIYAVLAHQASTGRVVLPSSGVQTDVEMISSLLPYCDAMLIDKENANILADGRVKKRVNFGTKIFAPKDRVEFLKYLDVIFESADPKHIEFIKEVYGEDWIRPYTSIIRDDSLFKE